MESWRKERVLIKYWVLVEWGSTTENLDNERTCFKWHAKMAARLLQAASMTSVARQSHYPSSAYVLAWSLRDCSSAYTAPARMGHKFYIYMYNTCSFSWPFRAPVCFFWSLTLNFGLSVYNIALSSIISIWLLVQFRSTRSAVAALHVSAVTCIIQNEYGTSVCIPGLLCNRRTD